MVRIFHAERKERWDLWLSEQKCQDPNIITEEGQVAFGNEIAIPYQLLVREAGLGYFFDKFVGERGKVALLNAHGGNVHGEWKWQDSLDGSSSFSYKSVKDWANERDGEGYNLLILGVCNPQREIVQTKRTPIIYPTGNIGYLCDYVSKAYNPLTNRTTCRSFKPIMNRDRFEKLRQTNRQL